MADFNVADLAANGGVITVNVSATDDSGVTALQCTDNGNSVTVGSQSGSNPRAGSFALSTERHRRGRLHCDGRDDAREHWRFDRHRQRRHDQDRRDASDGQLRDAASRVHVERFRWHGLRERRRSEPGSGVVAANVSAAAGATSPGERRST